MARLPTELYSIDVRDLGDGRRASTAELEFWWSGRVDTADGARRHFVEFLAEQGLVPVSMAPVDVSLVDEFRLLRWVVSADVVERSAGVDSE
jgi:hypothetical protein